MIKVTRLVKDNNYGNNTTRTTTTLVVIVKINVNGWNTDCQVTTVYNILMMSGRSLN